MQSSLSDKHAKRCPMIRNTEVISRAPTSPHAAARPVRSRLRAFLCPNGGSGGTGDGSEGRPPNKCSTRVRLLEPGGMLLSEVVGRPTLLPGWLNRRGVSGSLGVFHHPRSRDFYHSRGTSLSWLPDIQVSRL